MGETSRGNARRLDDRPPTETIRVLHVDDDESFLQVSQQLLTREEGMSVTTLTDPEAALERFEEFDCVVADYGMPSTDGIEFLEDVRARDEEIPFVLFTGKGSEAIASEAIGAGVTDYLQKKPDADRFAVLAERLRDAVDCRHAEMRAQENDEQVRRVYERITDAFVALDERWTYTYVNRQAAELLERDPESMLGETVWDSFPAARDTVFETEFRRAFEEQTPVTFEAFYEPLSVWLQLRVFPSESGLSVYFQDVTDRKERERRYDAIFNNTYQFTGLLAPDGTVLEANETALAFVDADRAAVVERPLWETPWFDTDEETRQIARESVQQARDGELYRSEFAMESADGESALIDFTVKPVYDDTGELALLIPEGRDITELKRRERQLKEKNEQLEKFASIVSHDLKTPLSVADGNLRLAMETGDHEFLEETADAIDRMGELIDELLELAKQGRVVDDPEPVALCSVLSDVETEAAVGTDTEVVVDCPDETTVVAERTRLHSLLSNLVGNAVEHGGGGVTVEVGFDGDTLYVADDGHGIPASERDSVFDPGHSGDDGTGFGLAIVETIADAHGWAVTVTESEAGGARFEVSGLETASGG